MRTVSTRLAFVLVAIAALAAVGTAGGASKAGGTFVIAGASDPTYLDPALVSDGESFRVTEQIFEGLVSLKPGSTLIRPGLATKWFSKNGKDWNFLLRRHVKFTDGTPFNAAAVCANFNRQYNFRGPFQDSTANYYWQAVFYGYKHNDSSSLSKSLYRGCTAKGKYTAVVHLTSKSSSFLSALVISAFSIQSPTAMKKYGANKGELRNGTFYPTGTYAFSHPTGTGPFKFKQWVVGQKVVLVRNNNYWGKKPRISRVIVQPISNNTARVQALQSGEVNGADLVQPTDVPTIKKNKNLKLLNRPSFNVACPPGSCVRPRPRRRGQVVLRRPCSGRTGVRAAAAVRVDEQGAEVPVQPRQGQVAAALGRAELAGQRGLLVPDERLAAVHAEPGPEFPGVLGEPREVRLPRGSAQRAVASGLRQARQRRDGRRPEPDRLDG